MDAALRSAIGEVPLHSCQVLACIPSKALKDDDISHKQTTFE